MVCLRLLVWLLFVFVRGWNLVDLSGFGFVICWFGVFGEFV